MFKEKNNSTSEVPQRKFNFVSHDYNTNSILCNSKEPNLT